MIDINLEGLRMLDGINDSLSSIKTKLEEYINLKEYTYGVREVSLKNSQVMRICLLVGLSNNDKRDMMEINKLVTSQQNQPYVSTFFTKSALKETFIALIKMRYHNEEVQWESASQLSKILGYEMLRGRDILLKPDALEEWFAFSNSGSLFKAMDIPELNLRIGSYDNGNDAFLDINSKNIPNTQMLIAGTTGSGKSNLLAVLIHQIREISCESAYPVNFLLFDYKGEFSDPTNKHWLSLFNTNTSAILDPVKAPLPFSPFKDFTGKTLNEINLYSTTMSQALISILGAKISANMQDRLSTAIIEAYKNSDFKPISIRSIIDNYKNLLPERQQDNVDSILSSLNTIERANLFSEQDDINLVKDCYIIDLSKYPKDGPIAKAIVYFVISKLNNIYELLPKQASNENLVELRHFTIIDEAHYMLDFENQPLKNLIAVGRNKGMSIILATQNMEQYKSKYFDYIANAQYPIIMKQQTMNDGLLRNLFGVNSNELQELKQEITSLQKGELIIKNTTSLGIGKKFKKIKVTHLI